MKNHSIFLNLLHINSFQNLTMKKILLFKTNYFTNLKTLLLFALCVFMNNQIANSQVRLTNVDEVKLEKDICIYRLNPTPFKSFIPPSDEVKERISRDVLSTNEIIVGLY